MGKASLLLLAPVVGSAHTIVQQKVVDPSKLRQLLPSKHLEGFKRLPATGSTETAFWEIGTATVQSHLDVTRLPKK